MKTILQIAFIIFIINGCTPPTTYELIIKNGEIIDGSGNTSYIGDIAISADTIAAVGKLNNAVGTTEIDATGLVVAPGFINMLSWAVESLIEDGKSQSDIRQGITLEVFGEGWSMGPLTEKSRSSLKSLFKSPIEYEIDWTTLDEYLQSLTRRGVSPNVASFLGATTLRINTVGYENRPATEAELETMRTMVRQAMEDGAMGIGSSLIYAPAFYSTTEELIEICKAASPYGGMYISHMRSEGNQIFESMEELMRIADEADIHAEIYHLKVAGQENWNKYDQVIAKIDSARAAGLNITTDMYTYTAGATGLDASMPPWVQEGGYDKWAERLQDPAIRKKVYKEMTTPSDKWENLMLATASYEDIILVGFNNDKLKPLTGKTLAEVAKTRNKTPEETAMDLVVEDGSRVGTVYFLMSEENVKKQIALPYMSFGSDAGSLAPEGVFLETSTHPRAFGNFARLLGKYVRDEKIISLEEAIYKLTALPAKNLQIKKRGSLQKGNYADLAIFDKNKIQDNATFDQPMQYATGMVHVFVNGEQVLKDGEHTGALPGKVVRGPGWKGEH